MGSSRTAAHKLVLIPSLLQNSMESISATQRCTSQAAQKESCGISSGLNLCNLTHRQHLWVFGGGRRCLYHLPALLLSRYQRNFLCWGFLCGVLADKRWAKKKKWQTSSLMLHHHQPKAAGPFPRSGGAAPRLWHLRCIKFKHFSIRKNNPFRLALWFIVIANRSS